MCSITVSEIIYEFKTCIVYVSLYILTLHVFLHIKHKQHKRVQNARHAAMRLVAQPQLIRNWSAQNPAESWEEMGK